LEILNNNEVKKILDDYVDNTIDFKDLDIFKEDQSLSDKIQNLVIYKNVNDDIIFTINHRKSNKSRISIRVFLYK
jgi:hypothetical protein